MSGPGKRAAQVLLAVLPVLLFRDAVLGRRIFYTQDITAYVEPRSAEILRAAAERRFPFWTSSVACGVPFFAEVDNAVLNPWNLFLALGPRRWVEIAAPLWCALAGLGAFALLAEWRLSAAAAALGGLTYGLAGMLVFYFDNPPYLNASAYLPLVLLGWHRALARRSPAWLAAAAALLALMVFAGDMQTVYDTALLALVYAWVAPGVERRRKERLGGYAVLGALTVALAAVQLVPTLGLLSEAPRLLTLEHAQESSFHPARFAELVLPFAFGKDLPGSPYWGHFLHTPASPRPWTRSVYVGILPLVLLPFAFAERRTRALAVALTAIGGLALAASVGPALPVYGWLYRTLPLFHRFRVPAKLWIFAVVAFAFLGALGLQRLLASEGGRGNRLAATLAAALAAGGLVVLVLPGDPVRRATLRPPAVHLALFAGASALALAGLRRGGGARLAAVLVGLQALDLALVNGQVSDWFGDPRVAPPAVAASRWLGAQAGPGGPLRIYHHTGLLEAKGWIPPPGLNPWERGKLWDRVSLDWNHAAIWGIEDVFGYTVLQDDRPGVLKVVLRQEPDLLVRAVGRLGTGWLLLPQGVEPPEGTRVAAELEGGALRIAAVEDAVPRVFLARFGRTVADPGLALEGLLHPAFDPRTVALIEADPTALPFAGVRSDAPSGSATLVSHRPGQVVVDVDVPEPRYLVLAESRYPGWTARVDGALRPVLRADYLMQAVALAPGDRQVEFHYRPPRFVPALAVSLAAWGAAVALWLTAGIRRRRPS